MRVSVVIFKQLNLYTHCFNEKAPVSKELFITDLPPEIKRMHSAREALR